MLGANFMRRENEDGKLFCFRHTIPEIAVSVISSLIAVIVTQLLPGQAYDRDYTVII